MKSFQKKKVDVNHDYSMVISNCTKVALIQNLSKVNIILLNSDGDIALWKLGYYDQGKGESSAGVSLFCDSFDGLRDMDMIEVLAFLN